MTKDQYFKPSKSQLLTAAGKTIPDIICKDLIVLFCGINPGLYSAAIGHHFGRPGNRFWSTLYKAGFTERLLSPFEDHELLKYGYGITNFVARATASADELLPQEYKQGSILLKEKVKLYKPKILAVLGIGAYRLAFTKKNAQPGKQDEKIDGTLLWVLPNPSGLNAHYDLDGLANLFKELKDETGR